MPIKIKQIENLTPNEIQRFRSLIDRRGPDECWPWLGPYFTANVERGKRKARSRRPRFYIAGGSYRPNRIVLYLRTGIAPLDLLACNACNNPACCNENHLVWRTHDENMAQMIADERQACGDEASSRKYRESRPRGMDHFRTKLTDLDIEAMLAVVGGEPVRGRLPDGTVSLVRAAVPAARLVCDSHITLVLHGTARIPQPETRFGVVKGAVL